MHRPERTTPLYPMRVAQAATGLSARQVRYYERAGLVSPSRSSSGHRLYSQADIDRLLEVKRLAEQGVNIAGMKVVLDLLERSGPAAQEADGVRPSGAGALAEDAPEERKDLSSVYPVCDQAKLERLLLH